MRQIRDGIDIINGICSYWGCIYRGGDMREERKSHITQNGQRHAAKTLTNYNTALLCVVFLHVWCANAVKLIRCSG